METLLQAARVFLVGKDAEERREMLEAEDEQVSTQDRRPHHDDIVDKTIEEGTYGGGGGGEAASFSAELFRDLDVFSSDMEVASSSRPLLDVLDKTHLRGGRALTATLLKRPIYDSDVLRGRQTCLKDMLTRYGPDERRRLSDMASKEADVLWMFRYRDDDTVKMLYDMSFYRTWFLKGFNSSSLALTGMNLYRIIVSPIMGLLSPVVYIIAPYLVMRFKLGLKISFRAYAWILFKSMTAAGESLIRVPSSMRWVRYLSCAFSLVFYFQSVFTSFEISSTLRKICRSLSDRVANVHTFFKHAAVLTDKLWSDDVVDRWFPSIPKDNGLHHPFPLPDVVARPPSSGIISLLTSNFGQNLKAFLMFDHASAARLMVRVYAIDALVSIRDARDHVKGCWTEFVGSPSSSSSSSSSSPPSPSSLQAPVFDMDGLRHPALTDKNVVDVVPNRWNLGDSGESKHALLTGPNAGGKSTLLKGVLVSALMSQTLTISPCETACRMTPFAYISSSINVPDGNGRESLFEAEMRRAKGSLDVLRTIPPTHKALVVMDEIFSSTNPVEGIAGAFAVARNMASYANAMCIISTHYLYLCRLERETKRSFVNYRMPVSFDDVRVIDRPYKLELGVSRQFVALELLRQSGFGDDILADAILVKNQLLDRNRKRNVPVASAPIEAPIEAPTETPTEAPTEAPIEAPTEAPIEAPTEAPIEAPIETPIETPTDDTTGAVADTS